MLTGKTLLLYLFLLYISHAAFANPGKPSMRHLYMEWQHKNSIITIGSFSSDDKQRIPYLVRSIHAITKDDIENWLGQDSHAATFLYHAMWAQQKTFHRKFIRSIDDAIGSDPSAENHDIISFIWHAGGIIYKNNWGNAFPKGQPLAPILTWVTQHYSKNVHVLCHSMGNRFFEGIVSKMDTGKHFRSITFFSADISNSSTETGFQKCLQAAHAVYIYIHKRDRFLLASSYLTGENRLGLTGPIPKLRNTTVIDMTRKTNSLSNHSNYNKKWVKEKLHEQWNNQAPVLSSTK